eukprot:195974-Chlamydomonas_euryale.AAC.2
MPSPDVAARGRSGAVTMLAGVFERPVGAAAASAVAAESAASGPPASGAAAAGAASRSAALGAAAVASGVRAVAAADAHRAVEGYVPRAAMPASSVDAVPGSAQPAPAPSGSAAAQLRPSVGLRVSDAESAVAALAEFRATSGNCSTAELNASVPGSGAAVAAVPTPQLLPTPGEFDGEVCGRMHSAPQLSAQPPPADGRPAAPLSMLAFKRAATLGAIPPRSILKTSGDGAARRRSASGATGLTEPSLLPPLPARGIRFSGTNEVVMLLGDGEAVPPELSAEVERATGAAVGPPRSGEFLGCHATFQVLLGSGPHVGEARVRVVG